MKILELTVMDRLVLRSILPTRGGLILMRLIKDLKKKIEFTLDEISLYELKDREEGGCTWNHKTAQAVQIEISPEQVEIIRAAFAELDRQQAISEDMMNVIDQVEV